MKKLGLIGGTGPKTTSDYYLGLVERAQKRMPHGHIPCMTIESIDCGEVFDALAKPTLVDLTKIVTQASQKALAAGADFIAFAGFSAHLVLPAVRANLPGVHFADIMTASVNYAVNQGFKRVGVFGNEQVMSSDTLFVPFLQSGISIVPPDKALRARMGDISRTEIEFGIKNKDSQAYFIEVAKTMVQTSSIEAILLANTDLPAYLADVNLGIEVMDTVSLHMDALVEEMFR